jgi:hypothetical protein
MARRFQVGWSEMGDLERILPDDIITVAFRSGRELVMPFGETIRAIELASQSLCQREQI